MHAETDYLQINKTLWNEKTKHHTGSAFYDMDAFLAGKSSLRGIELGLLGNVEGKRILHLQCHFGQDSLSLARMGAKVTGVDFSEAAIEKARQLNDQLGLDATFVCTDVYSLPDVLKGEFDLVFTSYGVLGWLPDMEQWARVAAHYVRPGGQLMLVEFHPVVWMYNYDFTDIAYSYFNREAIVETLSGTYADRDAAIEQQEVGWNHNMAEVLQALLDAGLHLQQVKEYDTSPCNCFNNTVQVGPDAYQIKGKEGLMPMVYAVVAGKG